MRYYVHVNQITAPNGFALLQWMRIICIDSTQEAASIYNMVKIIYHDINQNTTLRIYIISVIYIIS